MLMMFYFHFLCLTFIFYVTSSYIDDVSLSLSMLPPDLLMMFRVHFLCYLLICWWCFTFYVTSWSVDYVLLSLSTLPPDLLIMFNFHFLCYLLIRWWASLVPDLWFHRWQSKAAKSFFKMQIECVLEESMHHAIHMIIHIDLSFKTKKA